MTIQVELLNETGLDSKHTYVVYHARTGAILHVHYVFNFQGAKATSIEEGETRALGHVTVAARDRESLRVLRVEDFDGTGPLRVDVKRRMLVPDKPAGRVAKTTPGKSSRKSPAKRRSAKRR